jgi:hypothetical protein
MGVPNITEAAKIAATSRLAMNEHAMIAPAKTAFEKTNRAYPAKAGEIMAGNMATLGFWQNRAPG